MAESRIRDENYYQVSGWMLNRLGLKGTALDVYAIIYSFSQDGESWFTGSLQYLSDFTNTSRQTIISTLKNLVENGYLVKREALVNGVRYNDYRAVTNPLEKGSQKTLPVVKKLDGGGEETLPGAVKKLDGGRQKSLPHNKEHNKSHNKEHKELCANVSKKDADAFFETVWKLYPNKKGKGRISDAKKKVLYLIGIDEMTRVIDRYKKVLEKETWRKPQDGSTFFNGGYVDYLDENYSQGGESGGSAEKSAAQYGTLL